MQHTGHESPGAVDGIDHPSQAITRLESALLAKDAMLRVSSFDGLADRPLAGLIRQGHRIKAAVFELVGHLHAKNGNAAESPRQLRARPIERTARRHRALESDIATAGV